MHHLEHFIELKKITLFFFIKKKNLLIYDAVNKILIKNRISAPNLISHDYKKNFIEIQDFGNVSLFKVLKNKKKISFYFLKILLIY